MAVPALSTGTGLGACLVVLYDGYMATWHARMMCRPLQTQRRMHPAITQSDLRHAWCSPYATHKNILGTLGVPSMLQHTSALTLAAGIMHRLVTVSL